MPLIYAFNAAVHVVLLGVVLAGVQHYSGHWCIAIAVVAGLLFLRGGV